MPSHPMYSSLPLVADDDDTSSLKPRKRRRRFAKALRRCYGPSLILVGLMLGLGLGRIGVNHPTIVSTIPSSNDPVSTVYDSFVNMSPAYHPNETLTKPEERAVVTSLYTDGYAPAVATIGYSLSKVKSKARKIVIYLPGRISEGVLCRLKAIGWELYPVDLIPPPNDGEEIWSSFVDQYTKLQIWTLDRFGITSAVYIDADTLVVKNFDELFDLPFVFAAAPDVYLDGRGFTVGFNAGIMAIKPSSEVFVDMLSKVEDAKFNRAWAEQSYLNLYYGSQAVKLPYVYNGNLAIKSRSRSSWAAMQDQMRIIHYTLVKPFDGRRQCGDRACEGGEVFDVSERGSHLESAKASWDGSFREEIERWVEEYDEMMLALGNSCAEA